MFRSTLFFLLFCCSDAAFATETETVKLSCNYTGSVESLHWYRQYAGSPQFLILDYSGYVTHANPPVSGISISHRKEDNSVDLIISSAAVSDSALYYCALKPTVTGNTQHTIQEPETLLNCKFTVMSNHHTCEGIYSVNIIVLSNAALMMQAATLFCCTGTDSIQTEYPSLYY
uniref:Ig-like domain-containing protein n=1 Tax=Sinocyclocheilus grahami TaxID=75366 RepID=A0A672KU78_SINGR